MKKVRCAIYTRKSSEEGLEQDFNSLDAQREACSAYVLSQASEGWHLLPDHYDDGGLSGGTLERPALQRLLADVAEGRIDIIVVYKVDRLTRSLLDFAKLVEALDKADTSFVSVTQSFNTTTSMGRLTLNMLLSFAQFEREVTAERIRDKIAASKARGMWMGGTPPIGYSPDGRSLRIVEADADVVRSIFNRYLDLGNVRLVEEALRREGVRSPHRQRAKTGAMFGGLPFSRGQIYGILKCPVYVGEIHHKGQAFKGLHGPIVDRDVWDRTQVMLADNCQGHRSGARAVSPSPLAGKVYDAQGRPLIASHATKGDVRYRYYISLGSAGPDDPVRIPARELELVVRQTVAGLFEDPLALIERGRLEITPSALPSITRRCSELVEDLKGRMRPAMFELVERVTVDDARVIVDVSPAGLTSMLGLLPTAAPSPVSLAADVRLTRTGRAMRLVDGGGGFAAGAGQDASLAKLMARARAWWRILAEGEADIKRLAEAEGVSASYMTRVVRLAFLAPEIVEGALKGALKAGVDGAALLETDAVPALWPEQRQRYAAS